MVAGVLLWHPRALWKGATSFCPKKIKNFSFIFFLDRRCELQIVMPERDIGVVKRQTQGHNMFSVLTLLFSCIIFPRVFISYQGERECVCPKITWLTTSKEIINPEYNPPFFFYFFFCVAEVSLLDRVVLK